MVLVSSLVVAEGTFISLHGAEWPFAPVMYSQSHAQAWKKVTDAVHKEGGKIFFQPWHPGGYFSDCNGGMISSLIQNGTTGRIQNENMPMLKDSGYPVLAPSKVRAAGGKFTLLAGVPVSLSIYVQN